MRQNSQVITAVWTVSCVADMLRSNMTTELRHDVYS